jgi:hypothetical protein
MQTYAINTEHAHRQLRQLAGGATAMQAVMAGYVCCDKETKLAIFNRAKQSMAYCYFQRLLQRGTGAYAHFAR